MNMRLLAFLLLVLPLSSWADPLNYDYVYASRTDTEVNDQEADGDTFGGFLEFADHFHVTLSKGDAGWGPAGAEQETTRFGIGAQYFLNENTLLAPTISRLRVETDTPAFSASEDATAVQLELRHYLGAGFEVLAGYRYADFDAGSQDGLEVGVMYHLADWVAIGAIARDENDVRSEELTIRFYY
ncbi:MAG: hypothetical protein R3217_06345 [Gammaproteobacteria bacterium]|nr:hypothetical protein [Gammaproteobacteria bacterium]